jgi:hypothetical protein
MGAWLTLAAGSHYIGKWRQLADSAHAVIAMGRGLQEITEARRGAMAHYGLALPVPVLCVT